MVITVSKRFKELVAEFVSAVLADVSCIINEITCTTVGEELVHVIAASLTRWGGEGVQLARVAFHRATAKFRHDLFKILASYPKL